MAVPIDGGFMINVCELTKDDVGGLCRAFLGTAWERPLTHFDLLLAEQETGLRTVLVARVDGQLAGHASIFWNPAYPYFRSHRIPEIQDLNVVPHVRRRGIASRLLDEAEKRVSINHSQVGISFGLHPGYRVAQRLYAVRGYIPDGQGVFWRDRFPEEGETVVLDDHLLIHLIKPLG
jgi:GNAT superfamily N-acetyltransferase